MNSSVNGTVPYFNLEAAYAGVDAGWEDGGCPLFSSPKFFKG